MHVYLNIQKVLCVGNSSSGIKEAPFFRCVTLNIGDRQGGKYTLTPCTEYVLEIQAVDYEGNISTDNPKITFTTGYSQSRDAILPSGEDVCYNFFDN